MTQSICDCTTYNCQVLRKKEGFEPLYHKILERITAPPNSERQGMSPYTGLMMLHAYLENATPDGHECGCMNTTQIRYVKEILENAVKLLQMDMTKKRHDRIIGDAYSSIDELLMKNQSGSI